MRRYVGNLAARDGENRNLASYSFETRDDKEHAIACRGDGDHEKPRARRGDIDSDGKR
jgi:hypothetical protein